MIIKGKQLFKNTTIEKKILLDIHIAIIGMHRITILV